jgi:hypothetical protein
MTGEQEEEDISKLLILRKKPHKKKPSSTKTEAISEDLKATMDTKLNAQEEVESLSVSVTAAAAGAKEQKEDENVAPPSYSYVELLERVGAFIIKNNPDLMMEKTRRKLEPPQVMRGKCVPVLLFSVDGTDMYWMVTFIL